MSSRGPKRLVLNSHRFFRDISPEVLRELALEEELETDSEEETPDLYATITDGKHKIVLTESIREEYYDESTEEGFSAVLVESVIQHLRQESLIIQPRLPGGAQVFRHVPNYHRAFLSDAIRSDADYFITERDVWLSRRDAIEREYGLRIVRPGEFIRREGV